MMDHETAEIVVSVNWEFKLSQLPRMEIQVLTKKEPNAKTNPLIAMVNPFSPSHSIPEVS